MRRSPGRPAHDTDRFIATALQIIDDDGAEALSMRSLAQRLNSSTATLYRHFPNRAALIAEVIDRVLGEVALGVGDLRAGTWQQACQRLAHAIFNALERHRNVALLLADHPPHGPNAALVRECWLAVLLDNGFPPPLAARSAAMMARYVLGFAIQIGTQRSTAAADEAQYRTALQSLDPIRFPATAAAARALPVSLDDEFGFGLELILGGLTRLRD